MTTRASSRPRWTEAARAVYRKYPASVRSDVWPEIAAHAAAGRTAKAEALAKAHEDANPRHRAENVISRRLRALRLKLFSANDETEAKIDSIVAEVAERLGGRLETIANTPAGITRAADLAHQALVRVRLLAGPLLRDAIWQAARMGLRSPGEAFAPIFADNVESFSGDIAEQAILESVLTIKEIREDRLTFGLSKRVASRDPNAKETSPKWASVLDRIYANAVTRNNDGLTLSQRIFDTTNQSERALKLMLVREISRGTAPADVAKKARRFLQGKVARGDGAGPGVYKNPTKNLMRLVVTETNKAYVSANTAWAAGKPWLEGVSWTLSKTHDKEDECDDYAGQVMSTEEFDNLFPLHPWDRCYPTFVIKDEYLAAYNDPDTLNPGGTD